MTSCSFLTPVVEDRKVAVDCWIDLQAELLRDALRRGVPAAMHVVDFAGLSVDEVVAGGVLDVGTARLAIAKDHWYRDLEDALAHGHDQVDTRFEAAADAIHAGDLDTLHRLLDAEPGLVRMRSPFPHRQTLLHHVAANGIEAERQGDSPTNAVDILRLLIARGADVDATCDSYGGGSGATTLCLLVSSAWPAATDVQAALVEELCRSGAQPNGIDDDGLPLLTAIRFGYTDAAEALARCGARVDNLCFAAALGDLEAVRGCFDTDGGLPDDVPPFLRRGAHGAKLDPDRMLEYALIWAAAHDRRAVVEYLLTKNPDLSVAEPGFDVTALGAARYFGNHEIVALLEPAPPRA